MVRARWDVAGAVDPAQPGGRWSWPWVATGVNARTIGASCSCELWRGARLPTTFHSGMRKTSNPSAKKKPEYRWRVSMITGTLAKFVDFALAPDAETAERQVAKAHDIREDLRDRLVAIRED
jgi:hypothetical protein